jgi:hypothetical protein
MFAQICVLSAILFRAILVSKKLHTSSERVRWLPCAKSRDFAQSVRNDSSLYVVEHVRSSAIVCDDDESPVDVPDGWQGGAVVNTGGNIMCRI